MAFSFFSSQFTPIAVDFGSSCVKLLQCSIGEKTEVIAAEELEIPDAIRSFPDRRLAFLQAELPNVLRRGKFKGKKAVCSPPNTQTLVQHMQIPSGDPNREDAIKAQLQAQIGCSQDGIIVRWTDVADVHRDGQTKAEVICFAILRDEVMKHVDVLRRCKLDVVGLHDEIHAVLWAFDHVHRREGDEKITSLYIDLGWGGTKVAVSHGRKLAFAKYIQVGGKHFDQLIIDQIKCDAPAARVYRRSHETIPAASLVKNSDSDGTAILRAGMAMAVQADAAAARAISSSATAVIEERRAGKLPTALRNTITPGTGLTEAAAVDLSELIDAIADELCMCLRYHKALFPERAVDRAVFLGGEARHAGLCQRIAQSLKMPAQLGDPLARLGGLPGEGKNEAQPGWAVACGLCSAPTVI
jgi:Tfp pilus assembly PilM family ATPase